MINLYSTMKDLLEDKDLKKYAESLYYHFNYKEFYDKKLIDINKEVWPNEEAISLLPFLMELDKKGLADLIPLIKENDSNMIMMIHNKLSKVAVVCAGGGYNSVGTLIEAYPVCKRLYDQGFSCFMINYNVVTPVLNKANDDIVYAIKYINEHKEELNVTMENYIMMGFSAGGHAASQIGTSNHGYKVHNLPKPGMMCMCYPVISMRDGITHEEGTRKFFFGNEFTIDMINEYSTELHVEDYPPTFIWQCDKDNVVPFKNSLCLKEALDKHNIPNKLISFDSYYHGLAIGTNTVTEPWFNEFMNYYHQFYK